MNEWERTQAKDGKYCTDGMFHLLSSLAYEGAGETDNSLISLFKSVEAYKKGPVELPGEVEGFAYDRLKAGDRENDISALKIGPGGGANKWGAGQGASEIVIVGYAGRGPALKEQNWHGTYTPNGRMKIYVQATGETIEMAAPPLPAGKRGEAVNIKVSLPELQTFPARASYFTARLDDATEVRSVVINDMDQQAKKALEDAWNDIVTRTVIRVVTRTIAANEAKKKMNTGNALADLALKLTTDIAADQMEKADIRMCFLLPKTIQIARIPVDPGTHSVALNVYDGYGNVVGKRVYNNVIVRNGEKRVLLAGQLAGGKAGAETVPPAEGARPAPPPVAQAREASPAPPVEQAEAVEPVSGGEIAGAAAVSPVEPAPPDDTAEPAAGGEIAGAVPQAAVTPEEQMRKARDNMLESVARGPSPVADVSPAKMGASAPPAEPPKVEPAAEEPPYAYSSARGPEGEDEAGYNKSRKSRKRSSFGGGYYWAGDFGGGLRWSNGEQVAMPYSGWGAYAYFDFVYFGIFSTYYTGSGKWESRDVTYQTDLPEMGRASYSTGAFVKIPVGNRAVRFFPAFSVDYEWETVVSLRYSGWNPYGGGLSGAGDMDMGALWFRLGCGLDIDMGQTVYLRSEMLYGWRTANDFEKAFAERSYAAGAGADTRLGNGLTTRASLGFKF
jgi:hypothetical protein